MSGRLVGEVIEARRQLQLSGALGGARTRDRNFITLLAIAEGCRDETRQGRISRQRIADALAGSIKTASRALSELSANGLLQLIEKGNKTTDGGVSTLYELPRFARIDGTPNMSRRSDPQLDLSTGLLRCPPDMEDRRDTSDPSTGHLDPIDGTPIGVPLPVNTSRKYFPGGSHLSNAGAGARDDRPSNEPPPRTCSRHPGGTPDRCGACATAKQLRADWDRADETRQAEIRRARRELIDACEECDHNGLRIEPREVHDFDLAAVRCDHTLWTLDQWLARIEQTEENP